MVWMICLGTLAAIGGLCVLWTAIGWLLNRRCRGDIVCFCQTEEEVGNLFRLLWLRDLGLLNGRILMSEAGLDKGLCGHFTQIGIELCSPEELALQLGIGAEIVDESGTGDIAGHRGRGDLSEL